MGQSTPFETGFEGLEGIELESRLQGIFNTHSVPADADLDERSHFLAIKSRMGAKLLEMTFIKEPTVPEVNLRKRLSEDFWAVSIAADQLGYHRHKGCLDIDARVRSNPVFHQSFLAYHSSLNLEPKRA